MNHTTSKQQQWQLPLKKKVDSGKTFFDINVNTCQICMGFEADTPEKRQQHAHRMQLSHQDLVKKVIDERPKKLVTRQ